MPKAPWSAPPQTVFQFAIKRPSCVPAKARLLPAGAPDGRDGPNRGPKNK
jgi:hypothetical protein